MNAEPIKLMRPHWVSVARIVNRRLGGNYSGAYLREVAGGFRTNKMLTPILQEMGVMEVHEDSSAAVFAPPPSTLQMIELPRRPTQIVIPPEAQHLCDPFGIIDWKAVHAVLRQRLGSDMDSIRPYQLYDILWMGTKEELGILPILLELKLDKVVSRVMVRGSGRSQESHRRAVKLAEERGIPLERVIGSGPGGLVLKRDVTAYMRGYANQQNVLEVDRRILRQRRILAGHLREAIVANHNLRAEMRASQIRAGEVAQEMMTEISGHRTDMMIKNMEIKKITAERDALELECNQLKARLVKSKATNRRRVTHIKLGNELFRNRTKEHV